MTRASLLHILEHVNGISEAEIRELEQLATAFPYCQTAHVLLAKAAHDRGNMLAGQRLRRAATYAADRELLRQLIEQPAPEPTTAVAPAAAADVARPGEETAAVMPLEPNSPAPEPTVAAVAPETLSGAEPAAAPADEPAPETLELPAALAPDSLFLAPLPEPEQSAEPEALAAEPVAPAGTAAAPPTADAAVEAAPEASAEVPLEARAAALAAPEASGATETPEADDLFPPTAPPIRPPVGAGVARFEFGLAETEPEIVPAYQLPTLEEEVDTPATRTPIPAFRADADLAYALSGGGRLGYCLQLRDELTQDLPVDEFFAPDALLLAHIKAHTPPTPPPSRSSFELINKFLRAQPRLKAPARTAPAAEEQADLSVRSTQRVPDLASESLAQIMVRQGKIDKAIEIYERLMVRQPEKKAYFAEQIQQLKNPE